MRVGKPGGPGFTKKFEKPVEKWEAREVFRQTGNMTYISRREI